MTQNTWTIAVLDPITPQTAERLRGLLPPGMRLTHGTARDEAHLQSVIADADYAVSGQIAVPGTVLRAATRLKLLHKWGVGVDNFDLDAARELGITVWRMALLRRGRVVPASRGGKIKTALQSLGVALLLMPLEGWLDVVAQVVIWAAVVVTVVTGVQYLVDARRENDASSKGQAK